MDDEVDVIPPPPVQQASPNWREKWAAPKPVEPVAAPVTVAPPEPAPVVLSLERSEDDACRWMRRLYLVQGWSFTKIASHLKVEKKSVQNYLKRSGLIKKKKEKTWDSDDLMLPAQEAQAAVDRVMARERAAIEAARREGEKQAGQVVAIAITKEQIARDAMLKIARDAERLSDRIGAAIGHIEQYQDRLDTTDIRDLKDLTAGYLNLVRAARELAGEKGMNGQGKVEKQPPIRIGVVGSIRISGGGNGTEPAIEISR